MTDIEKAINIARDAKVLVYDAETSGLDWRCNFPIGHVLSDGTESVYIPIRHSGGGNIAGGMNATNPQDKYEQHPFERELAQVIESRRAPIVGHNMKFDAHFAWNVGIQMGRNTVCTQNWEALLNEYSKSFALDNVARAHNLTVNKAGQETYDYLASIYGGAPDGKQRANLWLTNGTDPQVQKYARADGTVTHALYLSQLKELEKQELMRVAAMEAELVWTLTRMERRGIMVDEDAAHDLQEHLDVDINDIRNQLPVDFNPRSPTAMLKYVTDAGRTDYPLTPKGNPSFQKAWLETFPEGEIIVRYRESLHILSSFLEPLMETHLHNGMVNASYTQNKMDDTGTVSGRLSCSRPNMQGVPKHNKRLAEMFRKLFVARPGMLYYDCDYAQIEPCLFAHYTQDQNLLDGYRSTPAQDVHTMVAEMLQVDRATTGKRMNMGMFTGMYPKTFAEHMGWDIDKATRVWNNWNRVFPGVRGFHDRAKNAITRRGYVRTLMGRRGRLEHPRFAYKAVSKIIQGGSADIIKQKLILADRMFEAAGDDEGGVLGTIHDSLMFETPDKKLAQRVIKTMQIAQEDADDDFNLRVPLRVDVGSGVNWAEASF